MEAVLNGIDHSEKQTAQLKLNDTVSDNITWCPKTPPDLEGRIQVHSDLLQLSEIEKLYPSLEFVVRFRNRQEQLSVFLRNMHAFLSKQQLDYAIFIVEQTSGDTFNRAKLMNIGFVEAMKTYDWQCFVFHDVDLLPEDDRNLYWCPKQPRHMSVAVDKFDYKLPYSTIFGGVTALTRTHMKKMHGFPNEYWGWGGEDDDIFQRLVLAGHQVSRYPAEIARYKMIKHSRERGNSVNGSVRMKREDLQGIRGYSIILVLLFHLFPFIFANGYIGVDIFFVLSGYLMTMIYKKKVPDYRGFLTFYRKRLLRLLPVYSLVIFLTLALGSFMLIRIDYEHFLEEALAALALATNIRNHNDGLGYFDRLTYYSFFLHTWSLAVEVQYYLIVPFIFYALQRWPRGATLGTTILTGLSFILGLMAELYEIDAYDFLFARIWQFQVGALSAQFTNRKVKPSEKPLIDDSLDERPASQTFHPYVSRLLSLSLLVFMLPASSYYWANYTSYDPHWSKQDMIENAIEKNEAIYEAGMFVLPSGCERTVADLSCRLRFGASNISVLAIGSSYNYMALPGLYEAMKESVGTLEVVSVLRWEPLLKTTTMHIPEHCAQCESVLEYARQQEKDILFIINRYEQYYLVQQGNSLKRIDYLLSRCPKCTFFDMQAPFCDSEKKVCRTIDEESFLGYFSDPHHITVAGMEKIVPALRSFVDDLIASINKS
ncbi:hypothetical protein QR680_015232 [Steinernema hermaphroditum]|uniref:Uncharacterized protein n=1 Tax=Steinernema hermaphroditum TaxID=289476 RepID=A0AA39H710_9BILA|nr:hypothetical protein QR680_015232 [Steinernema hermaphroditum]